MDVATDKPGRNSNRGGCPVTAARVLVVDDDPLFARLVHRALKHRGHQPKIARNVHEATTCLREDDFDLVVLDIFLPDGDGMAFCQQLRMVHELPVLAISSLEPEVGEGLVGAPYGPQAFLGKPFSLATLEAKVDALLRSA